MKTYSQWSPTQFDPCGLALPDRQSWLVAPVIRTRDSECLEESNFASALESLGGESDTVEVHRFGHWANGWFEIIIVAPDSPAATEAESIERSLEDYPVLDDTDLSNREYEAYLQEWEHGLLWRDFLRLLKKEFGLADTTEDFLWDVEPEAYRTLYEDLTPSGDYYQENGMCTRLERAVEDCTRERMARFIREERRKAA